MTVRHRVAQGEYLSQIAQRYGFADWRTVYHHADNAALRRSRPDPNLLFPGDIVMVPDRDPNDHNAATDALHRYIRKAEPVLLRIKLRHHDGEPLSGEACLLHVNEQAIESTSSADGLVEFQLDIDAGEGVLELVSAGISLPISIGCLDPVQGDDASALAVSGAQARLNNLGFSCGPVDHDAGARTLAALRAFQSQVLGRESPNGALDDATRAALAREHGC